MSDIEFARKSWIAERVRYEEFGDLVSRRVKDAIKPLGIWCDVSARAKELDSLIKKLITKPHHTYESIPDKSGVRVIVKYRNDVARICSAVRSLLSVDHFDEKAQEVDRVGYQSVHLDGVRLRENDEEATRYPPGTFCCEMQVRTLAQHLWAEMSHDTVYKNDAMVKALADDTQRRINLMAGQVEVADREFGRLHDELAEVEGVRILRVLERHFYSLTSSSRVPDAELSMQIINKFMPLYGVAENDVADLMDDFLVEKQDVLEHVYARASEYGPDNMTAFLFQPEVLLIYERLKRDRNATRRLWSQSYPERELERIANTFGISFD